MPDDTIVALSSGALPAAIGVIRVSGPAAGRMLETLGARPVPPRQARLRTLVHPDADGILDRALVLWFPGPHSSTGEDLLELHCHGGRAVVRAVETALVAQPGCRSAEAGEFTQRAFENGRIDLIEAEGLAELLTAETEWQRRAAAARTGGALSKQVEKWQAELLALSAHVEAQLDFADEDDVGEESADALRADIAAFARKLTAALAVPRAEKLRDGLRVALGGPPNSGKSTLLNALADRDAAIVSPTPGTTRDIIEVPINLGGAPFVLLDTAGLRDADTDAIEAIGIDRARRAIADADILLWLGEEGGAPEGRATVVEIAARSDSADFEAKHVPGMAVSARTGEGMAQLIDRLIAVARDLLPPPDRPALNRRQADRLSEVADETVAAAGHDDMLIVAEHLRRARHAIDRITGRAGTEDMLDALFGGFCIGK